METLNLQILVSGTAQALMEASASDYYQRVFKTLGRQLLAYAGIHETDGFSMDFGLQFLGGCKEFCVYGNLSFPDKSSICSFLLSIP